MFLLIITTIVATGLLAGIEFAVACFLNPIFARLTPAAGLAGRSAGAQLLGKVMPFWYLGSTLLTAIWTVLGLGGSAGGYLVTGLVMLLVSVLMSILLLVPINSRVADWAGSEPPADWAEQLQRWDRLHYLRVAVVIAALVLQVIAAQTH